MKLAFVAQPFDRVPGSGSIAIWVHELATRLALRHQIVVYSRLHGDQPEDEREGDLRHRRVPAAGDEAVVRLLRGVGRRLGREDELFYRHYYYAWPYSRGYLRAVAARLREQAPDAVVTPNFAQFVPALRRASPSSRILLMMQCDWLVELDRHKVERWLGDVDAICGCSEYVSAGVARRFPELASRCHPVHNGSNPERFVAGRTPRAEALREQLGLQGSTVILFTGRVCPEKGVHVLVEAMKRVADVRPDAVLVVVGGISQQPPSPRWLERRDERFAAFEALRPRYAEHLRELAAGLGERVRFVGGVAHDELAAYYGLGDVFVHPAVWEEPFGMILTEAMASGLPVVSTRAGGIPEIVVDGETGLLARPGDPESLAEAILELAGDPGRRAEMGRRGLERLRENFTWEHTARRMERVLLGLGEPAHPAPEPDAPDPDRARATRAAHAPTRARRARR